MPGGRLGETGSLHRRIVKTHQDPDVTHDYYYSTAWQVVEVRQDADADPLKQYVWDLRYIDAVACRFRDTDANGSLDETLYYCNDANMNVTALVSAAGSVVERYAYSPYGQPTVLNPDWSADEDGLSDFDNGILYCGYRYDPEIGLYHVRYRPYHPTLGRWVHWDKLGYAGGMNPYEYVRGRSPGCVDPFGLLGGYLSLTIPYGRSEGADVQPARFAVGRGDSLHLTDHADAGLPRNWRAPVEMDVRLIFDASAGPTSFTVSVQLTRRTTEQERRRWNTAASPWAGMPRSRDGAWYLPNLHDITTFGANSDDNLVVHVETDDGLDTGTTQWSAGNRDGEFVHSITSHPLSVHAGGKCLRGVFNIWLFYADLKYFENEEVWASYEVTWETHAKSLGIPSIAEASRRLPPRVAVLYNLEFTHILGPSYSRTVEEQVETLQAHLHMDPDTYGEPWLGGPGGGERPILEAWLDYLQTLDPERSAIELNAIHDGAGGH